MLFERKFPSDNFKTWLIKDAENKTLLKFAALAIAISFSWIKILYPYPNFMPPDSNSYLEAAFNNQLINLWAIGYSKFLRLLSSFSNSHFLLVLLQYLLVQISTVYFLFSIRYLLSPGKWLFRSLLAISIINPLLVHISNFVSSDALFIALSLIWLTQLLWIIMEPTKKILFWHAIIVLLAFMVRFAALYYPLISIAVIAVTTTNRRIKLLNIGFIVLLLALFMGRSAYEYKIKTNTVQYSAFGGWQIASNALYGYAFAKPIPKENVPERFRALHSIVNQHMDSLKRYPPFLRPDYEVAVYYLWGFNSPLRVYMGQYYGKIPTAQYFEKWASLAPLYAAYGRFLIKQRPVEFFKYYIWPNLIKYYTPPPKFMGEYNLQNETVEQVVVNWFGWKNKSLPSFYKDKHITITGPFSILFAAINIVFVLCYLSTLLLGGFKKMGPVRKKILNAVVAVWLINMLFSVFAAPIELRYQIFPMIFLLCFTWLMLAYIIAQSRVIETEAHLEKKPAIA